MTVEPIRNKPKIDEMYRYLNNHKGLKYGLLYKFGLNTGLRISDILPVKVSDIFDKNYEFKDYLSLYEQKTGKEKKIVINSTLREAIKSFVLFHKLTYSSYLFASKKGGHIGRVQAYRVLKESADALGIANFGTHSLRKTWGYWTYKISEYNIGLIMDAFNHSSQKITLRYIGINQEEKDKLYSLVQL